MSVGFLHPSDYAICPQFKSGTTHCSQNLSQVDGRSRFFQDFDVSFRLFQKQMVLEQPNMYLWQLRSFRPATNMKHQLLILAVGYMLHGCAASLPSDSQTSTAQKLVGKPSEAILACAGQPFSQTVQDNVTIFRYYKEASMFEESTSTSKASQSTMHHGCWASLRIEDKQVTGVEFRTVPEGIEQLDDECEELFAKCPL
jgi:hypothetical protein